VAFSPQRLTLARERRGLSKEDLAQACGVSRRAVTDWEAGRVDLPPLERLAAALKVPVQFLTGPALDEIPAEGVSFRALSSMTSRQQRSVLASARISIMFSEWLDQRYESPGPRVPTVQDLVHLPNAADPSPARAAELLRAAWAMRPRPITSMLRLLEAHGVRILSLPAEEREVDAFSFWMGHQPYVFLNQAKSSERVRFDLAHELGHLVLHRGVSTARDRKCEFDADAFASAFLMPTEGLVTQVATSRGSLRLQDIFTLKGSWRVSAVAMVRRLRDLSLINDWQYRTWMVDLSSQGYRRGEPDGIPHETSEVLSASLKLAREDGWTLHRIAENLAIPVQDLESTLSGLTLLAVQGGAASSGAAVARLSAVR